MNLFGIFNIKERREWLERNKEEMIAALDKGDLDTAARLQAEMLDGIYHPCFPFIF